MKPFFHPFLPFWPPTIRVARKLAEPGIEYPSLVMRGREVDRPLCPRRLNTWILIKHAHRDYWKQVKALLRVCGYLYRAVPSLSAPSSHRRCKKTFPNPLEGTLPRRNQPCTIRFRNKLRCTHCSIYFWFQNRKQHVPLATDGPR